VGLLVGTKKIVVYDDNDDSDYKGLLTINATGSSVINGDGYYLI
jgi:hypothetical protein